jgi:hypothetical protein
MPTERYHCETCGWDGKDPVLNDLQGESCGGVRWTLRVCPECREEVSATVILTEEGEIDPFDPSRADK